MSEENRGTLPERSDTGAEEPERVPMVGYVFANTNIPYMSEKVHRSGIEHVRVISDELSLAGSTRQRFVYMCLREEGAKENWLDIQMTQEAALRLIELLKRATSE